jgi:hypothetical protein
MSDYTPDRWILIRVESKEGEILYKVFGNWYGGYLGSDEWRISSGVTKVVEHDKHYEVHNHSGSVYTCYKNSKGMSAYGAGVFQNWQKQLDDRDMGTMHIVYDFDEQHSDKGYEIGSLEEAETFAKKRNYTFEVAPDERTN